MTPNSIVNVVVNWGDGTQSTFSDVVADSKLSFDHAYAPGFQGTLAVNFQALDGTTTSTSYDVNGLANYTSAVVATSSANVLFENPSISYDGQSIAFGTFVGLPYVLSPDVLLYKNNTVQTIAPGVVGIAPDPIIQNLHPVISADGQSVLYDHVDATSSPITFSALVYSGGSTSAAVPASGATINVGGTDIVINADGNGWIDGDGSTVAFYAMYHLASDPSATRYEDVFLSSGSGYRIISSPVPGTADGLGNFWPVISADGSTVAYEHYIDGSTSELVLYDVIHNVSVDIPNTDLVYQQYSLSADGSYVTYTTGSGVYVYDACTHTTEQIADQFTPATISADGRYVAYSNNGSVVVYDRVTHTYDTVSGGLGGDQPAISGDGNYVAYIAGINNASELVLVDLHGANSPLNSTTGPALLFGNDSNNVISLDGYDVAVGGPGSDKFILSNQAPVGTTDTVVDFHSGEGDVIDFSAVGITNISQLNIAQTGPDTTINFGARELILKNVDSATLPASSFAFASRLSVSVNGSARGGFDVSATGR